MTTLPTSLSCRLKYSKFKPFTSSWHLPTCDWIYRVWNTFSVHFQLGVIFVSFLFTWLHLFMKLCLPFLLLLPLFSNWAQAFNQLILLSIDISCSSFHALPILVICVFYSPLHLLLGLPLFPSPSVVRSPSVPFALLVPEKRLASYLLWEEIPLILIDFINCLFL